jgi:chromosome segregation ATPase
MEQVTMTGVRVICRTCGTVDQRSTRGSRRRAELELGQLLERIERELAAGRDRLESVESSAEYLTERVDGHGSTLEDLRHELHSVERKAEAAEYTADEAKREAERARASAERAGRGW